MRGAKRQTVTYIPSIGIYPTMDTTCEICELPINRGVSAPSDSEESLCLACEELLNENGQISVSPLDESDLELVLAWRSNPEIFEHFREQDNPLDWQSHVEWFVNRKPERYDFIIHFEGRRVGAISLAEDGDVGIYLGDFSARGHGVASKILSWLCLKFSNERELHAQIHMDNEPSKQLFKSCGFERVEVDGEWEIYEYRE